MCIRDVCPALTQWRAVEESNEQYWDGSEEPFMFTPVHQLREVSRYASLPSRK
jgi:hypothetical protein